MMPNFWVGRYFCQKRTPYNKTGSLYQDKTRQGQVGRSKNRQKIRHHLWVTPRQWSIQFLNSIIIPRSQSSTYTHWYFCRINFQWTSKHICIVTMMSICLVVSYRPLYYAMGATFSSSLCDCFEYRPRRHYFHFTYQPMISKKCRHKSSGKTKFIMTFIVT